MSFRISLDYDFKIIKKISLLMLIVCLILQCYGCYSRYTLPRLEPTEDVIEKTIEIQSRHGGKISLVRYQITDEKIIGIDKNGRRYEEKLENIKSATVISKIGKKQRIVLVFFLTGVVVVVFYIISIQGFSQLR